MYKTSRSRLSIIPYKKNSPRLTSARAKISSTRHRFPRVKDPCKSRTLCHRKYIGERPYDAVHARVDTCRPRARRTHRSFKHSAAQMTHSAGARRGPLPICVAKRGPERSRTRAQLPESRPDASSFRFAYRGVSKNVGSRQDARADRYMRSLRRKA